jgi:mono/diheme cytochrome c family protein
MLETVARSQRYEEEWRGMRMMRRWGGFAVALAGLCIACSPGSEDGSQAAAVSPAVAEGRQVYLANCTACHNQNPNLPGALGPDVAGSSEELLEARVVRGEYPPGYTPKRQSNAMIPLPHLAPKIPALAAYLQSVAKGS